MSEPVVSAEATPEPAAAPQTEDTGTAATLLGGKPDVVAGDTPVNGAPAPGQEPPKPYAEFKLPEGFTLDKALLDKVAPVLQKKGATQEEAQELVNLYSEHLGQAAKAVAEQQQKDFAEALQSWEKEIRNDPDFGGTKFDASVASARRVIGKFGSPGLHKLLDESGLGTNPEFFRFVAKIAGAFTESPMVNSNKGVPPIAKQPEEIMFDHPDSLALTARK